MAAKQVSWKDKNRSQVYVELEHPADLFIEVRGEDLPDLLENALFALYDQLVELDGVTAAQQETLTVSGTTPAEVLRRLLSEALYLFATSGFTAVAGSVQLTPKGNGEIEASARLSGETFDRSRHAPLAEIKAVTYHRLTAEPRPDGSWRATVLFDV